MSEIRDFNSQLNNSFTKRVNTKMKFSNQVDVFLKATIIKSTNFRQALIIGAGKMDDFSVSFFVNYMDKVVITDIDIESSKKAIDKLKLRKSDRQKIVLKEVEYTGFEFGDFFNDFVNDILKIQNHDQIDQFIQAKLEKVRKYKFLEYEFEKYDFIYVSPIYTQLVYNQLLMECSVLRQSGYPEQAASHLSTLVRTFPQSQHLLSQEIECVALILLQESRLGLQVHYL